MNSVWNSLWKTSRLLATLTHERLKPMRPIDAATIVELAAATWPNVKNTQATRDAWALALTHTNLYDAMDTHEFGTFHNVGNGGGR